MPLTSTTYEYQYYQYYQYNQYYQYYLFYSLLTTHCLSPQGRQWGPLFLNLVEGRVRLVLSPVASSPVGCLVLRKARLLAIYYLLLPIDYSLPTTYYCLVLRKARLLATCYLLLATCY